MEAYTCDDDNHAEENVNLQFTSICFTWNNWSPVVYDYLKGLVPHTFSYLIMGQEIGEEEGTPHLQCYAELTTRKRFKQLRKILYNRHFARRMGTQLQAIEYINNNPKKPNPVWHEFGTRSMQGQRNDLHKIVQVALSAGMREVAAISTSQQQIRHAESALVWLEQVRDFKTKVIWIHGRSGSGKSRKAREMCEELGDWYCKTGTNGKWFNGYDAHKVLWLDDVTPDFFGPGVNTFAFLLAICDRYPCALESKGGQRQMLATTVIITSLNHPKVLFNDDAGELARRIDQYIAF